MKATYRVLCTHTVNTYLLLAVESGTITLETSRSPIDHSCMHSHVHYEHKLWSFLSDTALLPQFLRSLSSERWFSACAALLRETSDLATLEKISIILQRLSKIK